MLTTPKYTQQNTFCSFNQFLTLGEDAVSKFLNGSLLGIISATVTEHPAERIAYQTLKKIPLEMVQETLVNMKSGAFECAESSGISKLHTLETLIQTLLGEYFTWSVCSQWNSIKCQKIVICA